MPRSKPSLPRLRRAFEEVGDQVGLARRPHSGRSIALLARRPRRLDRAAEPCGGDRSCGRLAGAGTRGVLHARSSSMIEGPPTLAEYRERVDHLAALTSGSSRPDVSLSECGRHRIMLGNLARAREYAAAAKSTRPRARLDGRAASGIARTIGEIELFAGDFAAAERELAARVRSVGGGRRLGPPRQCASVPHGCALSARPRRGDRYAARRGGSHMLDEDHDAQVGLRRARAKLKAARVTLPERRLWLARRSHRVKGRPISWLQDATLENLAEILDARPPRGRGREGTRPGDRTL